MIPPSAPESSIRSPAASLEGDGVTPWTEDLSSRQHEPESPDEAHEIDADDGEWAYWDREIKAGLKAEKRWRGEGAEAERLWFGDEAKASSTEELFGELFGKHPDGSNIVHANIETLKPLVYSSPPKPIVSRRFMGDASGADPLDRWAAELAQRVAITLIDLTPFDAVAKGARDDWLIPGRGCGLVRYEATISQRPVTDQATGQPLLDPATMQPMMEDYKSDERVVPVHPAWQRVIMAPASSWETLPWLAIQHQYTRSEAKAHFGGPVAEAMSYPISGYGDQDDGSDATNDFAAPDEAQADGTSDNTADQARVYEIWDRRRLRVVWWSPDYKGAVLSEEPDPLGLEAFYPIPKPLLAATKSNSLAPRPDIAYYRARVEEIDTATTKLGTILESLSVSGLYPGQMQDQVKKLLDGKSKMIAVEDWIGLMEKGGVKGVIQWLPIDLMLTAAQALIMLREQSRQAIYEISGISDLMRGQSDANETATAQSMKGNYSNLRLADRQYEMGRWARDMLRLMVELAVEHYDTERLAEMSQLTLPMTEAEREAIVAEAQQRDQQAMAEYEAAAMQAEAEGGEPPRPPQPTPKAMLPEASFEAIHAKLRGETTRRYMIQIETDSTILGKDVEDQEQRINFLTTFSELTERLIGMQAIFDLKVVKELLLFGVRGFRGARTLEGMIESLPDEMPPPEAQEDVQVTVANIRAEVDLQAEQERTERALTLQARDHAHAGQLKVADETMKRVDADAAPAEAARAPA